MSHGKNRVIPTKVVAFGKAQSEKVACRFPFDPLAVGQLGPSRSPPLSWTIGMMTIRGVGRWLSVVVLACLVWSSPAYRADAQSPAPVVVAPDYDAWAALAERVTTFVTEKTGTDEALADLRGSVQGFRAKFLEQQGTNASQIATLKEQIAALGPVPEGDAVETEEVASRRKALHDELARAQEPVVKAVEAYAHAESMLRALSDLDRERQAGRVMRLSPTPLDPRGWIALGYEAQALVGSLSEEARGRVGAQDQGWFRARALGAASGIMLGFVIMIGGWRMARRGVRRFSTRFPVRTQASVAFVVSALQVALPVMGVHLVVQGFSELGVFGPWWRGMLDPLVGAFVAAIVGFWIVRVFFDSDRTHADYTPTSRRSARGYAMLMVVVFAAARFVGQTGTLRSGSESVFMGPPAGLPNLLGEAASGAAIFPLVGLAALALWGFDKLRLGAVRPLVEAEVGVEDEAPVVEVPYRVRMLSALSWSAKMLGVVAFVMALVGYVALANYVVWSTVLMMGASLLLVAVHDFVTSVWGAVVRKPADEGLAPVVAGFALIAVAGPVFALAWGANPAHLLETLVVLGRGFPVGDVTLSPKVAVLFLITLVVGVLVTRVVKGVFKTTVLPRTRLDSGAQSAAVAGLGYVGVFLAVLIAVMSAGINLSSLAIVAGALSVGIGFGLQNIISNFVSGIILLIERPISVGDWIDAGGKQGTVRSVSVRSTRIRTFDNTEVIVPNSDLISNSVTNWTRGSTIGRVIIPVTVAFGTDTERVEAILLSIADRYEEVLSFPAVQVHFAAFASNGYTLELRAFLRDIRDHIRVSTLMRHAIVQEFAKEGIIIAPMVQEVRMVPASAGASVAAPVVAMVKS